MKKQDTFGNTTDLLPKDLGERAWACSDGFLTEMRSLTKDIEAICLPGECTDRCKWMDDWESSMRMYGSVMEDV